MINIFVERFLYYVIGTLFYCVAGVSVFIGVLYDKGVEFIRSARSR